MPESGGATLLTRSACGDADATAELLDLVYHELRALAAKYLRRQPGHTFQATDLVHEAYTRIHGVVDNVKERTHFFRLAARAMRRVLVDQARARLTVKRGGGQALTALTEAVRPEGLAVDEIVALDEALDILERERPDLSELVTLLYFGGYSVEEAAQYLGLSRTVAYDRRAFAKARLLELLEGEPGDGSGASSAT